MRLRDHPLMSYRGTPTWPPTWNKTGGGSRALPGETQIGEIGTLQQVLLSKIEPCVRCYLLIEFRQMTYMGTLIFDDAMFCRQIGDLLQQHCGIPIKHIGDLDVSYLL